MRNTTGMVSFTFDDVSTSACHEGRSILEKYNSVGTFYHCGGWTSKGNSGDLTPSIAELRGLVAGGHELGSHGFNHLNYQEICKNKIFEDIRASQIFLNEISPDLSCHSFAYPFGFLTPRVKRIVSAEFASARGMFPGINAGSMDIALLRAVSLDGTDINERKIDEWLEQTVIKTGWLIFFTHEVSATPSNEGCSPQLLEFSVRRASELGLDILPVKQALGRAAFRPRASGSRPG